MIRELRIDENLWKTGNHMRRLEWRSAIDDLVSHASLAPPYADHYVLLTERDGSLMLEFLDDDGEVRELVTIPRALLEPHVKEYLTIIRRLDDGAGHRETSWVEAVDMAKKVVHDTAARSLKSHVPGLTADHETYRRLFTLILSLLVDTTLLVHARGHRTL